MTAFGALNKKSIEDYAKLLGRLVDVGSKTGTLLAMTVTDPQGRRVTFGHPVVFQAISEGDTTLEQALAISAGKVPSCVLAQPTAGGDDIFVVGGIPTLTQVS